MNRPATGREKEAGFTLIEAMTAMVILLFGIAAVSNLMVIAGSSNTVANHSTGATAAATQQMELLKAVPYNVLAAAPGGSITVDTGAISVCGAAWVAGTYACNSPAAEYQGVGRMHVRWRVAPSAGAADALFIQVAAESAAPAVGRRSQAYFTSIRTGN